MKGNRGVCVEEVSSAWALLFPDEADSKEPEEEVEMERLRCLERFSRTCEVGDATAEEVVEVGTELLVSFRSFEEEDLLFAG